MTDKKPDPAPAAQHPPATPAAASNLRAAPPPGGDLRAPRRAAAWHVILPVLLVGLALGVLGGRYWFKDQATRRYDTLKKTLEGELMTARAEQAKAQAQVDALSGNLLVEESTRKGLETSLESAQTELGRVREQLAFFDQLFPPGPQGAVSIRGLDAELHGTTLQYRALLMRNAVNAPKFEGRMQFLAKGTRNGKAETIVLEPARGMAPAVPAADPHSPGGSKPPAAQQERADAAGSGSAAASSTDGKPAAPDEPDKQAGDGSFVLAFDEFQRSAGLLDVPKGFEPNRLTLNVLQGDAVRATRSITLNAGS